MPRPNFGEPESLLERRAVFILSAIVFLAYVFSNLQTYQPDQNLRFSGLETLAVARSIAFRGKFADPFFSMPTGPTAHLAPVYPAMLGAILHMWGEGPAAVLAVKWLTTLIVAGQAALLPLLSSRMRIGYLSGVFSAVAIIVGHYQSLLWEANLTGLLVVGLAFWMLKHFESRPSSRVAVLVGVVWGCTLLVSPVPLLVYVAWLLWGRFSGRFGTVRTITFFVATLITIAPWILRTRVELGHIVFIRDNLGLELAQFYCPCAKFSVWANRDTGCTVGPNSRASEASLIVAMGEVEYNHYKLKQAATWIRQNPGRSLVLTIERVAAYWFPTESGRLRDANAGDVILWIATPLSIPGLLLIFRKNRIAWSNLFLWMVFFPPVYYLVGQGARSRYPIVWVTLLPASYFVCRILRIEDSKVSTAEAVDANSNQEILHLETR